MTHDRLIINPEKPIAPLRFEKHGAITDIILLHLMKFLE